MPYEMNDKQFQAVSGLNAEARYKHFLTHVVDYDEVFVLKDPKRMTGTGGDKSISFWPHPDYAAEFLVECDGCAVERMKLDELKNHVIPTMINDGSKAVVFPVQNDKGLVVPAEKFRQDIELEIEIYIQKRM